MLSNIVKLGINTSNPEYLNQKIIISNFIAILFGVLSIPFCIFTYVFFQEIIYLPVGFFLTCSLILPLNYLGYHYLSRFIIISALISFYAIYQSFLTPNDEPLKAHLMTLNLLFWMPPWLMYHFQERVNLIFSVVFTVGITVSMPYLNSLSTFEVSNEVVDRFLFIYLCYVTTAIGISSSIYFLTYLNHQSEENNKKLIDLANKQNLLLSEKEKELNQFIEELQQKNREDTQRHWSSEGQTLLTKLVRVRTDAQSKEAKYQEIASFIANYVKITQVGVYKFCGVEQDELLIELVGLYGASLEQIQQPRKKVAEGILTQVYKSKKTMLLDNIPSNYLKISIGLGTVLIKNILVIPLLFNEKVYGIMELASLQDFEPYQIDFLEKAGESIAVFIWSMSKEKR